MNHKYLSIVFDLETTGLSPKDRPIQIGAACLEALRFKESPKRAMFTRFIWPGVPMSVGARKVHGISLEKLWRSTTQGSYGFVEMFRDLQHWIITLQQHYHAPAVLFIAYSAAFDRDMLRRGLGDHHLEMPEDWIFWDAYRPMKSLIPACKSFKLGWPPPVTFP